MKISFVHFRKNKANPRGGVTVAMEVDDTGCVVAVAHAICSKADNFCKKTGRAKSSGRLKSSKYRIDIAEPAPTLTEFVNSLYTENQDLTS